MFTGMRMGEINALQLRDINLNFKTISIDKTMARDAKGAPFISKSPKTESGRRVIPISETIISALPEIFTSKSAGTNTLLPFFSSSVWFW